MNIREGALHPAAGPIDAWLHQAWELRHEDTRAALALNEHACTSAWRQGYVRGAVYGLLRVGLCRFVLGDDDQSAQLQLEQAVALMRGLDDGPGEAEALNLLGHLHARRSEHGAAIEAYNRCLTLRRRAGDRQGEASVLNNLALSLRDTQRLADALELAFASLEIAREVQDEAAEAYALCNIGQALVTAGDERSAIDHFERCLALTVSTRDRALECTSRIALGESLQALGRSESAAGQLQQALALARRTGNRADLAEAEAALARVEQAAGRLAEARVLFDSALQTLAPLADRAAESGVLCGIGHNALLHGDTVAARATLQRALDAALASGAQQSAARAHELLATVHEQAGDPAAALAHWRRFHAFEHRLRGREVQQRVREVLTHVKLQPLRRELDLQRRRVRDLSTQLEALRRTPPSRG